MKTTIEYLLNLFGLLPWLGYKRAIDATEAEKRCWAAEEALKQEKKEIKIVHHYHSDFPERSNAGMADEEFIKNRNKGCDCEKHYYHHRPCNHIIGGGWGYEDSM